MTTQPNTRSDAHTPGPWKHVARNRGDVRVRDEIVSATGVVVVDDVSREEDARLIAAAPDQHAAAREIDRLSLVILSAVKADQPGQYDAVVAAILANRAAIASATGGEVRR